MTGDNVCCVAGPPGFQVGQNGINSISPLNTGNTTTELPSFRGRVRINVAQCRSSILTCPQDDITRMRTTLNNFMDYEYIIYNALRAALAIRSDSTGYMSRLFD
ncbi:PREDICTED: uncharacterized protein LOC108558349 [Nicrophorus vespilloides]|uniref:Uncharacterized protein LOC108558349 n=1 Tax=Nicrophorus vespilloides TaxID=110193 RepID=A0ABM1M832_NICVS|nr:PREDICTED: uncharacterized protein LOC108558349 [Nicrophorus vespilloides]